jgi:hypothetical protein
MLKNVCRGVTAEEKQHLRQAFLELIPQQDNQVSIGPSSQYNCPGLA